MQLFGGSAEVKPVEDLEFEEKLRRELLVALAHPCDACIRRRQANTLRIEAAASAEDSPSLLLLMRAIDRAAPAAVPMADFRVHL